MPTVGDDATPSKDFPSSPLIAMVEGMAWTFLWVNGFAFVDVDGPADGFQVGVGVDSPANGFRVGIEVD